MSATVYARVTDWLKQALEAQAANRDGAHGLGPAGKLVDAIGRSDHSVLYELQPSSARPINESRSSLCETWTQTAAARSRLERSWNAAAATGGERRQGQAGESRATSD